MRVLTPKTRCLFFTALAVGACVSAISGCGSDAAPAGPPEEATPNTLASAELLIIAPDTLQEALRPLADWKCQRGIPTRLVSLSETLTVSDGPDDAARLRAWLQAELAKGSLRHVLLAGDVEVMPVRYVDIEFENELDGSIEQAHAATDLYFADLDGDWDPDGNQVYGELADPADLMPDISVGRLPIATPDDAVRYVAKVLRYESTPSGDYEDRVLLGSAYAGEGAYATVAMEYYVHRELPREVPITMLYEDADQHVGALLLTRDSMMAALHDGHDVVFMMGHGSEESMGPLSQSDIRAIDNEPRPSIFVTCECSGGRFDYESGDSSGEVFVQGATGGVAYIGSTDLGIGFPSLSLLMRDLTRCLYPDVSDNRTLGGCLQSAQRSFPASGSMHEARHPDRWAQLVTVLLGDPTVHVWTRRPRPVQLSVDTRGRCDLADVTVVDAEGAPVGDATVTAYSPGAFLRVARTDAAGRAVIVGDSCELSAATLTVSGRNVLPGVRPWQVR